MLLPRVIFLCFVDLSTHHNLLLSWTVSRHVTVFVPLLIGTTTRCRLAMKRNYGWPMGYFFIFIFLQVDSLISSAVWWQGRVMAPPCVVLSLCCVSVHVCSRVVCNMSVLYLSSFLPTNQMLGGIYWTAMWTSCAKESVRPKTYVNTTVSVPHVIAGVSPSHVFSLRRRRSPCFL